MRLCKVICQAGSGFLELPWSEAAGGSGGCGTVRHIAKDSLSLWRLEKKVVLAQPSLGGPFQPRIFFPGSSGPDAVVSETLNHGQICGIPFSWKTLSFTVKSKSWSPFGTSVFQNLPLSISSMHELET